MSRYWNWQSGDYSDYVDTQRVRWTSAGQGMLTARGLSHAFLTILDMSTLKNSHSKKKFEEKVT